jgi:flagellar basal-body rod protein FlgC
MADPTNPATGMMGVAASAMQAQQARMRVIAENLANSDSVAKTAGGDPYRRQVAVFEPMKMPDGSQGVHMRTVAPDQTAFHSLYQPGHPSADSKGYVKMPNVDPLVEAMDMREAQRAYQANLNVIETAKSITSDTIALLNK